MLQPMADCASTQCASVDEQIRTMEQLGTRYYKAHERLSAEFLRQQATATVARYSDDKFARDVAADTVLRLVDSQEGPDTLLNLPRISGQQECTRDGVAGPSRASR